MEQLAFLSYTSSSGKPAGVSATDILRVEDLHDGSLLTLRDRSQIPTQNSVATILERIQLLLAESIDSSDAYSVETYAAGTAYSFTNSSAALDFGTTDPAIVIAQAGTYLIRGRVLMKYNAATFAANRTVTLKFRRTNNTAADITNGSTALTTEVLTLSTGTWVECQMPEVVYATVNTNDAITIYGDVSTVPSAGSLDATEAHILAHRIA